MNKTLYFHIGHYKTGTSAIQAFMEANTKRLSRHGIRYCEPYIHYSKHSALAFAIYRAAGVNTLMHGYNSDVTPEKVWDDTIAATRGAAEPITVVSSEEFMRLGAHPRAIDIMRRLAARPRPGVDIRILAWLRAPNAHLHSWYNQLIKMKVALPDYNTTLRQVIEPVHYNYKTALAPWVDIFGPAALAIHPYDDSLRQGTAIYEHFLRALGKDLQDRLGRWWIPETDLNPRLDDRLLELTRIMQSLDFGENDIAWAHQRALAQFNAELRNARSEPKEFDTILADCAAGLDYVAHLPGNAVDTAVFMRNLPQANDPLQAETMRMMGLLIEDIQRLRIRLHQRITETDRRIDALEARLRVTGDGG